VLRGDRTWLVVGPAPAGPDDPEVAAALAAAGARPGDHVTIGDEEYELA
jgi:hypothetical protein